MTLHFLSVEAQNTPTARAKTALLMKGNPDYDSRFSEWAMNRSVRITLCHWIYLNDPLLTSTESFWTEEGVKAYLKETGNSLKPNGSPVTLLRAHKYRKELFFLVWPHLSGLLTNAEREEVLKNQVPAEMEDRRQAMPASTSKRIKNFRQMELLQNDEEAESLMAEIEGTQKEVEVYPETEEETFDTLEEALETKDTKPEDTRTFWSPFPALITEAEADLLIKLHDRGVPVSFHISARR